MMAATEKETCDLFRMVQFLTIVNVNNAQPDNNMSKNQPGPDTAQTR